MSNLLIMRLIVPRVCGRLAAVAALDLAAGTPPRPALARSARSPAASLATMITSATTFVDCLPSTGGGRTHPSLPSARPP
eukprot:6304284-Prymnesium_polylepis.1